MFERIGHMIPLIFAVGNHDVGLNELSGTNITVNEYGPPYLSYFPQHFDRDNNGSIVERTPPIEKRRTFFYHTFSNALYVSLDSGYMHDFKGL